MDKQIKTSRTLSAEVFTQLVLQVFRFNGRLIAAGDRLTKELGLTSALWQVLGAINEAPLPVAQIARNMGLSRQSVRRTANVLKKKEFVDFHENPNHQRAKLVKLTKQGHSVLKQVTKLQIDWSNHVSKGIDEKKLKTVIQMLNDILEKM